MNTTTKILNLRGEEMPKSYPSKKEMDKLPLKDKSPDIDKLEKETVGNVILNCLTAHKCDDKKEGFYINLIADSVLAGGEKITLKDKLNDFLIEVLEKAMIKDVKDEKTKELKQEGIYAGWVIAKILQELGVKE